MYRVELKVFSVIGIQLFMKVFLMHRVELKDEGVNFCFKHLFVPNAPCGVERMSKTISQSLARAFLMYRVELKVRKMAGWRCHGTRS